MPSGIYKRTKKYSRKMSDVLKNQWKNGVRKGGWKHTTEWKKKQSKLKQGHINYLPIGYVAWNKGIKLPKQSGEKHHNWIKDRTKLKKYKGNEEKRSPAYKYWRKTVCDRDGWKCKIDNKDCSGRLEVHHILGYTEHPELRYDINNGITLCHFHHPRVRKEEKRLIPYFMELVSVSKE
jgi:hypothetical protein